MIGDFHEVVNFHSQTRLVYLYLQPVYGIGVMHTICERSKLDAWTSQSVMPAHRQYNIIIFVNLGPFRHFETVTNIRTWIKSHMFWRML